MYDVIVELKNNGRILRLSNYGAKVDLFLFSEVKLIH